MVVSQPCAAGGLNAPMVAPAPHDLYQMVTSGYLDKLGFDYRQPSLGSIVRQPDTLRTAFVAG